MKPATALGENPDSLVQCFKLLSAW